LDEEKEKKTHGEAGCVDPCKSLVSSRTREKTERILAAGERCGEEDNADEQGRKKREKGGKRTTNALDRRCWKPTKTRTGSRRGAGTSSSPVRMGRGAKRR
jgi:hypothetical protein